MIRELILLPVKLPLAIARAGAEFAVGVAEDVLGLRQQRVEHEVPQAPPEPAEPAEPEEGHIVEGVSVRPEPDVEGGSDGTEHRREVHEAEFGAEGGAEFRVSEPWQGYDEMRAAEIVARLRDADAAKLAIVRLYEANHLGRKTVLRAADSTVAGRAGTNGA